MRDYDKAREEKDTDFTVAGEVFTVQPVSVAMVGEWVEREDKVDLTNAIAYEQMCIDRVADAVEDGNGASERWRKLCASPKGPTYGELMDLSKWVWTVSSELPTMPPAPSAPGRGKTAVSSAAE